MSFWIHILEYVNSEICPLYSIPLTYHNGIYAVYTPCGAPAETLHPSHPGHHLSIVNIHPHPRKGINSGEQTGSWFKNRRRRNTKKSSSRRSLRKKPTKTAGKKLSDDRLHRNVPGCEAVIDGGRILSYRPRRSGFGDRRQSTLSRENLRDAGCR